METKLKYHKKVKPYNMIKMPRKQSLWSIWFIGLMSRILLRKQKRKLEKFNMEGLKPPYLMLCNHNQFMDFEIAALATFPRRMNSVASLDAYVVYPPLIRNIGSIPKRKFTNNTMIIRQIKHTLTKYKNITTLYPEARYNPSGATAKMPDSLYKMIKLLGLPVVVLKMLGHHLQYPDWADKKRKVPVYASMTQVLSTSDIKTKKIDEIKQIVLGAFEYNDYDYQLKNNIKITEPFRAEGLHKILYQCKSCGQEFGMTSEDSFLRCNKCSQEWQLRTDGQLEDRSGKTLSIPEWYDWEREQVKEQIMTGAYKFEEENMLAFSMPHPKKMIPIGSVNFRHDNSGFKVSGSFNGQDFEIVKEPLENYAVHVEYSTPFLKRHDIVSFSDNNDSYFFVSKTPERIQKISLATEELYEQVKSGSVNPHAMDCCGH
ncbi:MAG: hypothetical protein LBN07_00360 [Christensenellaceae bacterium]|jgi:1-acyl-sn-glycerol-3-phosphate acyltransferase|nr:hypothetical protein [Christensenellaceae bacterium]